MDDSELALERALQQLRSESPEPCSVMESSTYGSLPELENSRFDNTKLREAHSLMEDSIYCSADSLFSHHTMENSSTDKGLIYRQLAIYSPEDWSGSQFSRYPDSAKATVGNNAAARPSITASHLAHFAASDNVESRPLSSTPLKPVSREEVFFWDVCERLLAVAKDRESMTFQVRSLLRQRGKSYDEIMSAEWYNLSEVEPSLDNLFFPPRARALPSPSTHHLLSPLEPPAPYLDASKLQGQPWSKHNVRQIPRREGVANRKCCCNYCGPSDSGVGVDMFANDLLKSANSDHIHAYVRQRNQVASILPERQRSAQAAASALMSNSPQPEELNFHGNTCRYYDNGRYDDRQVNGIIPQRAGQQNFNTNHSFPATQLSHNKNSYSLTKQHVKALPRSRVLTLVVYTLNELSVPYAKKLSGNDFTLKDFKEKVFGRTGEYRYFFKDFFPDVNMEVFEELSDEAALLPVLGGKIEARVEKM